MFSSVKITYGNNLSFDGVTFTGDFSAAFSSQIAVTNSTGYGLYFRDVNGVTITGNTISGGAYPVNLFSVQNFTITDNTLSHAQSDLIQISRNSYNGLIENNVLYDPIATSSTTHPDMIQIFGWDGMTPHDIVIRGNHLYDDPATGLVAAQGIFLSDPQAGGFRNILIEENLISVRNPNSIYVAGGTENVQILHNTLIAGPEVYKGGTIRLVDRNGNDSAGVTVEGNLALGVILDSKTATVGDNILYGSLKAAAAIFQGNGQNWQDFIPRELAGLDHFGASELLDRLLARQAAADEAHKETLVSAPEPVPPAPVLLAESHDLYLTGNLKNNPKWGFQDIVHLEHEESLEVSEGTVAFTIRADTWSWKRGLFSKDSAGLNDGLTARVEAGKLIVLFEDDKGIQKVTHDGLKVKVDYDLQITFGDGEGRVYVDGKLVGAVETGMDWHGNHEEITLGADNVPSSRGTHDAMRYAFDGILSDFAVYDQAMTPEELQALTAAHDPVLA